MPKKTNLKTKTPARGGEHEHLKVFLGKWHAEGDSFAAGQSKKNPRGAVEKWVSDETVEWLPGNFFIVHRWEATTGNNEFKGIAIISHDTKKGAYTTRSYENHGYIRDYVTRVDGNVWTFKNKKERARVEFKDDGNTQKVTWEWRPDGKTWLPLCDRVATRTE